VAGLLRFLGRKATGQLFRKEAMAVVGLSWVLATVLGAFPFQLGNTYRAPEKPMTFVDAMFEAQSGFSTTGATVLTELEDPTLVPRCILFWRSSTHFLGGLGIIVLFVAILGQGSAGKALMRAEMPGPGASTPQARMQHTAWVLFLIYITLNGALTLALLVQGLSLFDALCHAFGTMATGGFSTYNASVGHFATVPGLNGPMIEMTIVLFMILAGTNFMLMYWVVVWRPGRLFTDVEWLTYATIIIVVTILVVGVGLYSGDFDGTNGMKPPPRETAAAPAGSQVRISADGKLSVTLATSAPEAVVIVPGGSEVVVEPDGLIAVVPPDDARFAPPSDSRPHTGDAVRYGLFQVVSVMTTTGFCTDDFNRWNAFGRGVLLLLMFVGGCAGSTGGGMKVIRHILFVKVLRLELEHAFHPSVVRPLRVAGEPVEDRELGRNILVYFALVVAIFAASWLFTITLEPDETWTDHGHSVEHKLIDGASCVAATLHNIGPGLGVVGATKNYSHFSWYTKLLFIWLMMLGRLELFVILVLFVPAFWRTQ
jgi:Trk-type K+ transport system membrane component